MALALHSPPAVLYPERVSSSESTASGTPERSPRRLLLLLLLLRILLSAALQDVGYLLTHLQIGFPHLCSATLVNIPGVDSSWI